jgi:dTDP-4-amino-4,6-dideoxygalactose transaminase
MRHVVEETKLRAANAEYLTAKLAQVPGIVPRRDYPQVTRTAFYYYGFRYRRQEFGGPSRDRFLAALQAEGIPASRGLGVVEDRGMNKEGLIGQALASRSYRRAYSAATLEGWAADNECPLSDRLCEETVGFHQRLLLGTRADMDDVASAIVKLHESRDALTR